MSSKVLSFVRPVQPSGVRSQMSPANGVGRFRVVPAAPDRAEFMAWWSALLRRRCGGQAAVIAKTFTCTEQCARYWLDSHSCPNGLHVDLAMTLWPGDFAARHGQADGFALQVAA